MVIAKACRLGLLLVGLSAVGGCANTVTLPDGTSVPKDEYRASQQEAHAVAVAERLQGMIQDCPHEMTEKEASECRWSNAMTMVVMPQIAANLTPQGYWQYKASNRQFWLGIAQLVVNNPLTNALAYGSLGGGGGSVKIMADGESRIDNIDMTTGNGSPFTTGEDNVIASGSDSQIQEGDGTQGQAISRPNNQPNPSTEGGNINNNSEGLGLEGSL